jgi:hypothetical protein
VKEENVYENLVSKPEGKWLPGRPGRRCAGNKIKMKEIGTEHEDWIHVTQDRGQWRAQENIVKKLPVP